ncbi:MAG: phytanoyl-CoA dioxygenase family protein [Bdellovibrionales bacterium]|nr:phytanoyl-CoA dioxygenase family protein [Bdellovibrionales bacterium]
MNLFSETGFILKEKCLSSELVDSLKKDLYGSFDLVNSVRKQNGVFSDDVAQVNHHLIGFGDSFFKFLDLQTEKDLLSEQLGEGHILNIFGGHVTQPTENYVSKIHRDVRYFTDHPLMIQFLVPLDDFTDESGPFELLPYPHVTEKSPDTELFEKHKRVLKPQKGDLVIFDSRLWHRAGRAVGLQARSALTLAFTPSYFKPQMDYTRLMGADEVKMLSSDYLRQLLGLYSRTPQKLEEWYSTEKLFTRA